MDSHELMTVDEVAAMLRVPPSWIYARTCPQSPEVDRIPFLKLGRHLRFRRSEVLAWIEGHHRGAKPLGTQPDGGLQATEKASLNLRC